MLPPIEAKIQRVEELALFLDYDGTLTSIRSRPEAARLPVNTRHLLEELSRQPGIWVAVVSGRALLDLKRKVGIKGICYVGNHGLELQGPKLRHINPVAQKSQPLLKRIARLLKRALKPIVGAWVEDKGLTLAVHYREVKPQDKLAVRNLFHEVVRPYREQQQVRVTAGKQVFEVRPPVRWTKGTVVQWLLARREALRSGATILPIYIGDDQTDEDAFEALRGRGICIAVGASNPLTRAQYRVSSPDEVVRFLKLLLRIWDEKG